jgi:hypothetical protein
MDARGWNGEPDAQDDALEHDGHLRRTREQRFSDACHGLVQWIHAASDPRLPLYAAYRGNSQGNAIWYARFCYREARALGLLEERADERRTA